MGPRFLGPGVDVVFPLDTTIDLLRSVHSTEPGSDFLRTSTGGGGGGGAIIPTGFASATSTGQVSVTSSSTQLFAANATRAYAHVFNNSSDTIYLQFSIGAALQQGIRLVPGAFYTVSGYELWLGEINAISTGSSTLIDIFEAGY